MLDMTQIVKDINEGIEIKDNPKTLNVEIRLKKSQKAGAGGLTSPIPNMHNKDGVKQLMKLAGMGTQEVDYDVWPLEGGTRLRFKNQKDKAKMKALLDKLFRGDLLEKVFAQLNGAFTNMGQVMEDLAAAMQGSGAQEDEG